MHTVALHLAPVLAAEKSKVPFYVAGGALVLWALLVSLGLGMRKPDFPSNLPGQRTVSAITAVLVLAAVSTAVITSGSPAKPAVASAAPQASTAAEAPAAATATSEAATSTTGSAPAPATTTTQPAAPAAAVSTKLALAADPGAQLLYNSKQLSAKAGTVTIDFTNASPLEHNLTIAQGSTVLGATPTFTGGAKGLTVKLKPGTYTFYCSVPGHRQAGMEGTLSVS
jgi:plastocyanin